MGQVCPCGGASTRGVYLELVEREVPKACVHPGEVAGLDGVHHLRGGAERQGLEVVVLGQLVLLQAVVYRSQAVVGSTLVHGHPWGGKGSTQGHHDGRKMEKQL